MELTRNHLYKGDLCHVQYTPINFDQRLQLLYSKGARFFEDTPVPNATIDDIDLDFVAAYTKEIGYGRSPLDYLRGNKDFIITRNGTEQIISAAILLFGKNPQRFFPRARVLFSDDREAQLIHIELPCVRWWKRYR